MRTAIMPPAKMPGQSALFSLVPITSAALFALVFRNFVFALLFYRRHIYLLRLMVLAKTWKYPRTNLINCKH